MWRNTLKELKEKPRYFLSLWEEAIHSRIINWAPTMCRELLRHLEYKAKISVPTSKVTKPVHPRENQPWIFIGRTDAEAKTPIFWAPDAKSWLIGKDPDAGKDWGWEKGAMKEKGARKDKMVGWHHQLNRHEFEQTAGVSEGQGSLACFSPLDH